MSAKPASAPILLFGLPRSGTTWIGKLFDSHPDTLYRHEPDSIEPLNPLPLAPDIGLLNAWQPQLARYAAHVADVRHPKVAASLPRFPKSYLSRFAEPAERLWIVGTKVAERVIGRFAGPLPVPSFTTPARLDRAQVVWKSIESVGRLGLLLAAVPAARGVLILRHPCGQAASVLRGQAGGQFDSKDEAEQDWPVYEQLVQTEAGKRYGLTLDALKSMSVAQRLAWRWVLFNEKALDDVQAIGAENRLSLLIYDDVCAEPATRLKPIFAECGLGWPDSTERFIAASTGTERDQYYSVFKNPAKSANAWRTRLSPEQIADITAVASQSRLWRHFERD